MNPPAARSPLTAAIREAIAARGVSAYALAQASGVDRRNICRWLAGESDLMLASADRLAVALGLRASLGPARRQSTRLSAARTPAVPLPGDELLDELAEEVTSSSPLVPESA